MTKTVLIVDDVTFVRKTLRDLLTDAGYSVIGEATNGEEAITQWNRLRPDIVTMDVVMPKMSGIEATKQILKQDSSAVVIMVSAMDQIHLVMEAIHVGARDYIQKPFHSDDVKNILERSLQGEQATVLKHITESQVG